MGAQPREVKVLTALSASMTVGFIVMMALGDNPPPAGAFCLASYYHLEPSESLISSVPPGSLKSWNSIEVSYVRIGSTLGKSQSDRPNGIDSAALNSNHFLVCSGIIGGEGQITATRMWRQQQRVTSGDSPQQAIRICVMVGGETNRPTDLQAKRVQMLLTALSREFGIHSDFISYRDWQ